MIDQIQKDLAYPLCLPIFLHWVGFSYNSSA
jgi:hypothetical protein